MKLRFVGDLCLAKEVGDEISSRGADHMFALIGKEFLEKCDYFVFNLECCVSQTGVVWQPKPVVMRAAPESLAVFEEVDTSLIANLANNHFLDFGERAAEDTLKYLCEADIQSFGISGPELPDGVIYLKGREFTVGLVGIAPAGHRLKDSRLNLLHCDEKSVRSIIRAAQQQSDVLIVSMHHGLEYVEQVPRSSRQIAKACIEEGADCVIGHHSHIINGIESYLGRKIFYGLGNFLMDRGSLRTDSARRALAIDVTIEGGRITDFELLPIQINDDLRPELMRGEQELAVLKDVQRMSKDLEGTLSSMVNDYRAAVARLLDRLGSMKEMLRDRGVIVTSKYYVERILGTMARKS